MIALVLLLVQSDPADLVRRALAEEDKEKRAALVSLLRKSDLATVEKAVRTPLRAAPRWEVGRVLERTAKSDLDGEEFPYAIHIPAAYSPSTSWPVLVTLHGANGSGNPKAGADWIRTWLRTAGAADRYILLAPTTVRHTWGSRQGYSYVLTALREAGEELALDHDRVFLDGMSMGAGGAFRLAEHVPDRWAAIGPRCNVPSLRQKKDKTYITMLPENFRNVPVYWIVGAKDETILIEMARAARPEIERARGELVYREFPDGGHDWALERDETVLEWYDRHRRATYPEEVAWKSYEKIFARAYWVEVLKRTEPPPVTIIHLDMSGKESERRSELHPPALVRARRSGPSIDITTEEVRELRVWLDDAMTDLDRPVTITVNGRKAHDGIVRRSVDTLIDEARRRHDLSMTFTAFVDLKIR
jgi:pimeloyl-ACP methyl ester carboxylesterase